MKSYLTTAGFSFNMIEKHDKFIPEEKHIEVLEKIVKDLKDRNIVLFIGTNLEMMYIFSIELANYVVSELKRTVEVITLNNESSFNSSCYLTVIDDAFLATDKQRVNIQRLVLDKFKNGNPLILFFLDTEDVVKVLDNMFEACQSRIQSVEIGG